MVKFIFGNLPKLLIYIWDEKYIENIFGFDMIYIEFGLDLEKNKKEENLPSLIFGLKAKFLLGLLRASLLVARFTLGPLAANSLRLPFLPSPVQWPVASPAHRAA